LTIALPPTSEALRRAHRSACPLTEVRACAEIIHTLCLPQFAIAALSSVNVPRHASLLRLALTNSFGAFCTNNLFTVPKRNRSDIENQDFASMSLSESRFFDFGSAFVQDDTDVICHPERSDSGVEGSFSV
jgi:hypothetical protein